MSVAVATRRRFSPWDYPLFLIVAGLYCAALVVFAMSWLERSDWGGVPVAPVVLSILLAAGLLMYGLVRGLHRRSRSLADRAGASGHAKPPRRGSRPLWGPAAATKQEQSAKHRPRPYQTPPCSP